MKHLFTSVIALAILGSACSKPKTTYKYTGTITGPDLTTTICSGGYLITIDGAPSVVRFTTLPAGSGIDLATATFPINVKLNWHSDGDPPSPCGYVTIDAIKKAD